MNKSFFLNLLNQLSVDKISILNCSKIKPENKVLLLEELRKKEEELSEEYKKAIP